MSRLAVLCFILGLCSLSIAQEEAGSSPCACESQVSDLMAQLDTRNQELYAAQLQLWEKSNEHIQTSHELAQCRASLEKAQQASQDLSLSDVAKAMGRGLKSSTASMQQETLAIMEEAKQGRFDRVQVLALGLLNTFRGAASSVYAFLAIEADEHLPPAVKDKLRSWAAAANSVWHVHVVEAAWAAPAVSRVRAANQELMAILTTQLRAVPSLQPYADPAFVQLLVYALFGLPLLLVVILPLALALGTRKAEEAPNLKKNKSSKGKSKRV